MIDSTRQFLTEEGLGECWHENFLLPETLGEFTKCGKCKESFFDFDEAEKCNRTFITRDDMMDLFQKIKERGKIDDFDRFLYDTWEQEYCYGDAGCYLDWLFVEDHERSCQLVADFLERGKK